MGDSNIENRNIFYSQFAGVQSEPNRTQQPQQLQLVPSQQQQKQRRGKENREWEIQTKRKHGKIAAPERKHTRVHAQQKPLLIHCVGCTGKS
ncbi:8045_t:CDS:2 [Ambispora leptoticha]|uniref:8045_t:CDS:1 n=1 Tax=Ambispora leptoticha TaxID=144679 RepID=A0A9N8V4N4_9GLOM|nr:8045_t:CDS:2 [Ambispora leptoticha]